MAHRYKKKEKKRRIPDRILLFAISAIVLFGLIMLYSATGVVGLREFNDSGFFIKRQLLWLGISGAVFWYCYRIDYHRWQNLSFGLFIASMLLLVAVLMPGVGISGQSAQRWIDLGVVGFQPSELVKLTLVLFLASWFSRRSERIIQDARHGLLPFVAIIALLGALILSQPDLGTLIIIISIALVLYFIAGARFSHMLLLIGSGLLMTFIAIKAAPYRLARLSAFLNPSADPHGAGYHITQALIAVGSGGLFGLGLGQSRQKFFYLPEVAGDSLFAVIAEELGFFASALVVFLFIIVFWRGVMIAKNASDSYGKLVAIGITIWIVGQAFINIGAMLNVVPLTGMPLPLMSYGGSSMVVTLAAMGVLFNISKQRSG